MTYSINKKYWNKRRVFVTGHTGFKGSWLCIYLSLLGAKVTGYSLKPKKKPNLFELANIKKLIKKSVIADIKNFDRLFMEIRESNADTIFHLAAQPLVRYSYKNPKETFDTNFNGSLNILECVKKIKKIKSTVIITSDKVYDVKKNKVFKENDLLGGIDPYSASKVCIEHLFFSYKNSFFNNNNKQKLATVRAGNVIGGGDYSEDRLIPDIYRFKKNKKKIILRNPKAIRPWQHVLEPLSGYLLLAQSLHSNKIKKTFQSWNFGPNLSNCKSVFYIAKYLSKKIKLKIVLKESKKSHKPETKILRLSNNKARRELNWKPKWGLNKTLDKILIWNNEIKMQKPLSVCEKQIKDYLKD
ncbi:CDP-glucose 4,6-dehydratase [Pelagibacteraceae bacterium]|nr:CDP-glucose 4,6-dehydratase [Pelagibacteraceae bacterium]